MISKGNSHGEYLHGFTVSKSQLPDVIAYIKNQREHHYAKTFQEEYLELLRKHDVDYDERHVWGMIKRRYATRFGLIDLCRPSKAGLKSAATRRMEAGRALTLEESHVNPAE